MICASSSALSMPNSNARCGRGDSSRIRLRMSRCLHSSPRSTLNAKRSKRSLNNWKIKPMTEIERILDQLKRAYEGSGWYGSSVREVLSGVTAEQAQARPFAKAHSIWELTHHIAVWESTARRRLSGE